MSEFSMQYRVPYADTDQMGVVYYANFLIFMERARNEYFRSINYPYFKLEEEGIMLPVVQAHVDYKNPARYDDLLSITAKVTEMKGCRVKIENRINRTDGQLVSEGYTVHCSIDKNSRKPVRIPQSLINLIDSQEVT